MPNAESRRLTELLIALNRLLHEQMKRRTSSRPLSTIQLHALACICKDQPLMRELAARLTITPPSATTLVNGLVRSRLVTRKADPHDQRAHRLALTPLGKSALRQRLSVVTEGMQEVTSVLSRNERKALTRLMEKIVASYER